MTTQKKHYNRIIEIIGNDKNEPHHFEAIDKLISNFKIMFDESFYFNHLEMYYAHRKSIITTKSKYTLMQSELLEALKKSRTALMECLKLLKENTHTDHINLGLISCAISDMVIKQVTNQ